MAHMDLIQPLQTYFGGQASLEAMDNIPTYGFPQFMADQTQQNPLVTTELKAKFSEMGTGQAFSIPALDETPISVTSTETYDIPLNLAQGNKMDLVVVTQAAGFQIPVSGYFNAEVSENEVLNDRMMAIDDAFADTFSANAISYLDANRNQKALNLNGYTGYSFDTGTDLLSISKSAQQTNSIEAMEGIFKTNKKKSNSGYSDIVTSQFDSQVLGYYRQRGVSNTIDLQKQMAQARTNFYYSDEITNSNDFTGYKVRNGEVGVMHTIDPNFRSNLSKGSWQFSTLPTGMIEYPFEVGVFTDYNLADVASLNNYSGAGKSGAMGVMAKYVFVTKYAFVKKHNSNLANNVSGIIKYTGLSS